VGGNLHEIAAEHLDRKNAGKMGRAFTLKLISKIDKELEHIDKIIEGSLTAWPIERLSVIDKNIIRLGTCELLFFGDIPRAVVIDEAINLATTYGGVDSAGFVNGVLDAISKPGGDSRCSTE
jgi:N utilization substance protein B